MCMCVNSEKNLINIDKLIEITLYGQLVHTYYTIINMHLHKLHTYTLNYYRYIYSTRIGLNEYKMNNGVGSFGSR